ncbi:helicase-associated domain-containing protein [Streptomyces paromomycinus]|uniref:Uncharacterized protein n=1 Tax=Streptomyces paromomycinus TaxID=92743 RepID=A0A401W497_STREY|nr:helicase-associated domain-containing protein [Streptomyces paromomycinus]GCD44157.1 hypothetical protein GKJPGBOP_03848 [Streptomyces paromomycinus]
MTTGATLTAWLHSLDGPRLARVLAVREDVVAPPEPRSAGELADRLQRPGSVGLALLRLSLPCLQAAEALAALGGCATRDALAKLLGVEGPGADRALDATLDVLAEHALVWTDGSTDGSGSGRGTLRMAEAFRQAWDSPLGLDGPLEELLTGATSDELRGMLVALGIRPPGSKQQRLASLVEHHGDPVLIASLVAKAPAAARELLVRRARTASPAPRERDFIMLGGPGAELEPDARWALDRGLLIQDRDRYGTVRMPVEVALALRGPNWNAPFDAVPPSVQLVPVAETEVDREAEAAATAFAAQAATVLSACSASPPARLKSGAVGARELARLSKVAQAGDAVVRITLEAAYAAGLIGYDGDRVAPTEAYDVWAEKEPPEQFTELSRAWWSLSLAPSAARDEDGKVLPALAGAPPCDGCLQARHGLLAAAARLPAGQGARAATDLGQLVAWYRPLADPGSPGGPPLADPAPQDEMPFSAVVREAELLGVLARGALSRVGAALLAGDTEELAVACRRLLPEATATARLGTDLTAVVTGTPTARLTALLDAVADRETSGTASVWRFSAASVRRALDAGHTPESITADLDEVTEVTAGRLPQPLAYLIADTARGHGRVRIAPAACVIHGTEPALLAELAAHRALSKLGLRLLAPTVLLSRSPLYVTLGALRAEGYAPVAETVDGTVRIEKVRPQRAAAPVAVPVPVAAPVPAPVPVPVPVPRSSDGGSGLRDRAVGAAQDPPAVGLRALADRLLAAPADAPLPDPFGSHIPYATDTEEIVAGYAKRLSYSDVRQLAHALNSGTAITIDYVAASGIRTVRTLSQLDLDPPFLEAWCHLRNAERVFTLSRIHGVMPP